MSARYNRPLTVAPRGELSDEAAAMLIGLLAEIMTELQDRYAVQLHRYHARPSDDQLDLWDEPPF